MASAVLTLLLAVGLGVLVLTVFDWSATKVAYGAALGLVVWGAFYAFDLRHQVPTGDALPIAPADARVERGFSLWRLLVVLPLFVALAWFADWADLGALFVPGQMLGRAAADLGGAVMVRRWERAHETSVVIRWNDSGEPELYEARPQDGSDTARLAATYADGGATFGSANPSATSDL